MDDPKIEEGWLLVPYEGEEGSAVEIGFSSIVGDPPIRWYAAYLDYYDGVRVAKVFAPTKLGKTSIYEVYLRVSGSPMKMGKISV